MEQRENLLLIVILMVSASLLALLYSSESPYKTSSYNNEFNSGVNFGGKIENANALGKNYASGISKGTIGNYTADFEVFETSTSVRTDIIVSPSTSGTVQPANYAVKTRKEYRTAQSNSGQQYNYSGLYEIGSDISYIRNKAGGAGDNSRFNQNTNPIMAFGLGSTILSKQNSSTNIDVTSHGFLAMSIDLNRDESSLAGELGGLQKVEGDPGGDPGTPIPVPEGWGLLLLLGMVYAGWKIKGTKFSSDTMNA